MKVNVRTANEKDVPGLVEMYNKLRKYELSLLPENVRSIQLNYELEKTDRDVLESIHDPRFIILVALSEDNELIGFVTAEYGEFNGYREGEISFLYVEPKFRGHGVGKLLFEKCLDWFNDKGCKSISINVYAYNNLAKRFYSSLGFTRVQENWKKII